MISLLKGRLIKETTGQVVIDVNGVGYKVVVPLSTFYKLPESGTITELKIHTHVKENAIELYGFFTDLEREIFVRLLGVSGVGPKGAVNILSHIKPKELVDSILREDLGKKKIPGIGPKTSRRIINELKDKLIGYNIDPEHLPVVSRVTEDVISVLSNLGFTKEEIDKKLADIERVISDAPTTEEAIKESIKIMKRG